MAIERTLSIVKPDGVEKGIIGKIISRFETNGLKPVAIRMQHLSKGEAEGFYAVHKERPFFKDLVSFMTSGPVVVMCLEGICQEETCQEAICLEAICAATRCATDAALHGVRPRRPSPPTPTAPRYPR